MRISLPSPLTQPIHQPSSTPGRGLLTQLLPLPTSQQQKKLQSPWPPGAHTDPQYMTLQTDTTIKLDESRLLLFAFTPNDRRQPLASTSWTPGRTAFFDLGTRWLMPLPASPINTIFPHCHLHTVCPALFSPNCKRCPSSCSAWYGSATSTSPPHPNPTSEW